MEIYEKPNSSSDTCELYRRLNKRSKNRFASFLKKKKRVSACIITQLLPVAFMYSIIFCFILF